MIVNVSVPGHEQLFNVHRCSMYTGIQFILLLYPILILQAAE